MFKREENTELFDIVVSQNKVFLGATFNSNELTDEQLEKVVLLKITSDKFAVSSFDGLEKLTSLKSLTIDAVSASHYYNVINYYNLHKDELKIDFLEQCYKANQLTDLSKIYKLKNLQVLELCDQRNLKEIDLSNFPKLKCGIFENCTNLEKVKGLDKIEFSDEKRSAFDFNGCDRLCEIENFDILLNKLDKLQNNFPTIFLPTTTYMFLNNEKNYFKNQDNIHARKAFRWTELSLLTARVMNTTNQMKMMKGYIDNVLKTVCDSEESSLVNANYAYRWLINNVKYDKTNYDEMIKMNAYQMTKNIDNQDALNVKLASSFACLFDKKAICSGISNLYNMFLADLGIKSEVVNCYLGDDYFEDDRVAIPNHQISAIKVNGQRFYFDPTSDMGYMNYERDARIISGKPEKEYELKRFALNKEELEDCGTLSSAYCLDIAHIHEKSDLSIESDLNMYVESLKNLGKEKAREIYYEDVSKLEAM